MFKSKSYNVKNASEKSEKEQPSTKTLKPSKKEKKKPSAEEIKAVNNKSSPQYSKKTLQQQNGTTIKRFQLKTKPKK